MKNTFSMLFLIYILFNSCVDQGGTEVKYTMFNETDKTVKVLGFNKSVMGSNGIADPIIISPNSDFTITKVTGFENTSIERFYSIQGVDSVRVVFGEQKVLIYTLEQASASQDFSIFRGDFDNQHFITEQDYENAEDCNGNCE